MFGFLLYLIFHHFTFLLLFSSHIGLFTTAHTSVPPSSLPDWLSWFILAGNWLVVKVGVGGVGGSTNWRKRFSSVSNSNSAFLHMFFERKNNCKDHVRDLNLSFSLDSCWLSRHFQQRSFFTAPSVYSLLVSVTETGKWKKKKKKRNNSFWQEPSTAVRGIQPQKQNAV